MNAFIIVTKRLFTSLLSTFDIVSDLVNSCDFLGYNASNQIIGEFFGRDDMPTTNDPCQIHPGSNGTLNTTLKNDVLNNSICVSEEEKIEVHLIWGILGIVTMFIPGLVAILMFIFNDSLSKNKFRTGDWSHDWKIVLILAAFPFSAIVFQFYSTFMYGIELYGGFMAIGVALEAFLESFLQLVLQMYTILYGYDITTTQIATISASFFILAKASIDLDLQMYDNELSVYGILKHCAKLLPGYTATIAFRVISFALTIAFLRPWAIIPISLLIMELAAVCHICFRKLDPVTFRKHSGYPSLIITNLGVTNVGIIGANEFMWRERKETKADVEDYYKETNKFIRLSSVVSFLHHSTVLSVILSMVTKNPTYFEHWKWTHFIIKSYDGHYFEHKYCFFIGIIGLGVIGLMSSLHLGAVGLKIVGIGSKEKDPDEPERKSLTEIIMNTIRRSKP